MKRTLAVNLFSDPLMSMMASYLKNRKQKNEVSKDTEEDVVNKNSYFIRNAKLEIGEYVQSVVVCGVQQLITYFY